jgi:glycosyltransferase involved in cell wall biosynthesis
MRIAYIANARMPTEKAHGLQVMQMCRAFAQIGHEVTLVVPKRKNWIDKSIWEFYGMEPNFKMVEVPIVDFIVWDKWLGNWALWLTTAWFGFKARRVIEDLKPDVIYSRDPFSSAWTPKWVPNVFEAHTFPNRALWFYRWLWNQCDRVVSVTAGLQKMFAEQGIPESRLRVAADAVDLEAFTVTESKEACRRELNLPLDKFLVVYAGHLYPYKGIPDQIEAGQWLSPDIRLVIVGGRPDDLERTKALAAKFNLTNVIFVGRVPHKAVPKYLRAADLATMPYTRESHHVEYYSSPMKLFEYLAAGAPIISTDLPAVREILDDETAEFVPAEDPKALADGINRLHANPSRLAVLSAHSSRLAKNYTWKSRAVAVLDAMPKPRVEWKLTFWKRYRSEILLALLALVIRFAYVGLFPQHPLEGGDSLGYIWRADIIRGLREADPAWTPFFQPGYPYFLAAIRTLFGDALIWARLTQAALSAATVFLMAMIARRWISPYAARVAGLVGALYPPMILESGIFYTETLYTFLLTLAVFLFLRALDSRKIPHALLCGAAFVAAGLTRELGFYVAALLVGYAAIRKSWRTAAIVAACVMLAMAGTSLNNRRIAESRPEQKVIPLVGKGYESTVMDPVFHENILSPDRYHLYPLAVWRYFRYPFRMIDLSEGVSIKKTLMSGDLGAIMRSAPEVFTKGVLVLLHWFLLVLAAVGLTKLPFDRRAKVVLLTVILFAAVSIMLGSIGRKLAFELFEPLARYRFPTEPLILVLSAAGVEYWSRKREGAK